MEPGEIKKLKVVGGTFQTDKNLELTMPPKSSIEKDLDEKDDGLEIKASKNTVEIDENGKVLRRTTEDGKVLTGPEVNRNSGMDR